MKKNEKNVLFVIFTIALLINLSGCFETNIIKNQTSVNPSQSFNVLIPSRYKGNGVKIANINTAILSLNLYSRYKKRNNEISSLSFASDNESFELLKYKCLYSKHQTKEDVELGESANCNQFSKQAIKMSGSLKMKALPNNVMLTVIPKNKVQAANSNYGLSLDTRDLKSIFFNAIFPFQFEVNSKYSSESTYASFARMLRKASYNGGKKDPVTGKIFKDGFIIKAGGKEISIRVKTFPYRNGSKAVVYALIPPKNKGNVIDFYEVSEQLKVKIKELVRS